MTEEDKILNKLGITKENPFKAPDKYFDEFPTKIQEMTAKDKFPKTFKEFLVILKPQLKLASIFLLFVFIGYVVLTLTDINSTSNNSDSFIELAEMSDYEYYFIDEDLIIDALTEESDNTSEISGDDIIEYLEEEENISYYALLEEY